MFSCGKGKKHCLQPNAELRWDKNGNRILISTMGNVLLEVINQITFHQYNTLHNLQIAMMYVGYHSTEMNVPLHLCKEVMDTSLSKLRKSPSAHATECYASRRMNKMGDKTVLAAVHLTSA